MSERNTKSNILYLHRHALILMVREYTKFECENCNRTFYDRKSAEEHESLCMDEERKLQEARELIGRCFRQYDECGTFTLYKITDAYMDYRWSGDDRKKTLVETLQVHIWPRTNGTDSVRISEEEFVPELVANLEEVDERVFLSESLQHISEMFNVNITF